MSAWLGASFSRTGEWWKKVCFIFFFISLSSSSYFPVAPQYSGFSYCCENVRACEWSEHVWMEEAAGFWSLNFSIPRGVTEFAFCTSFSPAQGCALTVRSTLAGEVVASYLCGVGETGLSQRILFFFLNYYFLGSQYKILITDSDTEEQDHHKQLWSCLYK